MSVEMYQALDAIERLVTATVYLKMRVHRHLAPQDELNRIDDDLRIARDLLEEAGR